MKTNSLLTKKDIENVMEVLETECLWRENGKFNKLLEEKFSNLHNASYALSCTNGTNALEAAFSALEIGYGDEVIIPAYTFIASASSILTRGAIPIPCEVNRDDYCIDPKSIESKISNKTKAILVVHISGHACDMDKINEIAYKYNLYVVEDSAHAHGAKYKERVLGGIGDISTYSFQAIKAMTSGEGGMILTNTLSLYHKLYSYFNCGRTLSNYSYDHVDVASNYRMSEMQAALLYSQCDRLLSEIKEREKNVRLLNELLENNTLIIPQKRKKYATRQTYSMWMFVYNSKVTNKSIDEFLDFMKNNGYELRKTYPPFYKTKMFTELNNHPLFKKIENLPNYKDYYFENAEYISDNVIWIPHHFLNNKDNIYDFIEKLNLFYRM